MHSASFFEYCGAGKRLSEKSERDGPIFNEFRLQYASQQGNMPANPLKVCDILKGCIGGQQFPDCLVVGERLELSTSGL